MYKTQEYKEYSRRLVRSLGFAVLTHMQWKVNVFKVHRYKMIKRCLHLPLFPVYNCSEFFSFFLLISNFSFDCRSLATSLHCWRTMLLLLEANKQHKQTNKQSRLRTNDKHKRNFRRSALNDTTYCYDRDNARTIENGAIVNRTQLSRFVVQRRRSTIRLIYFIWWKEVIDF